MKLENRKVVMIFVDISRRYCDEVVGSARHFFVILSLRFVCCLISSYSSSSPLISPTPPCNRSQAPRSIRTLSTNPPLRPGLLLPELSMS